MIDIINKLYIIHNKHPELRLLQILYIAASKVGYKNNDLFYIENRQINKGLDIWIEETNLTQSK